MSVNPFEVRPKKVKGNYYSISQLALKSYDKYDVDPYTKTRIILMNGTEFESVWFYHQFARNCSNNDLRREIADIRRVEQQQQKRIGSLKPIDETILETTLSYEQLAVDLTAILAQREKNTSVRDQLNFALLEDFDHLYRFTDLLEMEEAQNYKKLIGSYTEIMPGRPTVAEHRDPADDIRFAVNFTLADPITKLNIGTIIGAEQQTMNYYMNVAGFYHSDVGRKLFSEIAMIEEQHVSGYESLKDPNMTWLEKMLVHEYNECYLYYSCYADESDAEIKKVWERHFNDELVHLQRAVQLLKKYEGKDYREVIPVGTFPMLLTFKDNKKYIREVLKNIRLTAQCEHYENVGNLDENNTFKLYQNIVVKNPNELPSHIVIDNYIKKNGKDLRYEIAAHPEKVLQDRQHDNVTIGRVKAE